MFKHIFNMVREIKFRAWNESAKRYSNPFGLHANVLNYTDDDGLGVIKSLSNEIVEQYTGLKDKNGTEIYEGDIVKTGYPMEGSIYYSYTSFGVKNEFGVCTDFDWEDWEKFEIIGNIHENPELLNHGSKD